MRNRAVLRWGGRRWAYWLFAVPSGGIVVWSVVLTKPWEWDYATEAVKYSAPQTFATWAAFVLGLPAAFAAWEAYRLSRVRVPVGVTLADSQGPEFNEELTMFFENQGEVAALGLVIELRFNQPALSVSQIWTLAEQILVGPTDGPDVWGATYLFNEPASSGAAEVLCSINLRQPADSLIGYPDVFQITWRTRGGNVAPRSGLFRFSFSQARVLR